MFYSRSTHHPRPNKPSSFYQIFISTTNTVKMDSLVRNQVTAAQIRALEDAVVNPLTNNPWPKNHDGMLQSRRNLPVYERLSEFLRVYQQNQVFVLSSGAGSAKSTQVPQFVLSSEYPSGLLVACTQPRRLATRELATRVSNEMGVTVGEEVGYRPNNKKTRLLYMTADCLLSRQARDAKLSKFAYVIVDEVHERTTDTDILLALLKKILRARKDFKVIIMSATVDAAQFQRYYNGCLAFSIPGQNYKVDVLYMGPKKALSDVRIAVARVVLQIHKKLGRGDILVFLPGEGEILDISGLLGQYADDLDVVHLYGRLAGGEQSSALRPSGSNRRCILSTNIAETSLTIPNIAYVVDSGLSKQKIYNPRLGLEFFVTGPIAKTSADQRKGRAGRTQPGTCFRLYSKEDFEQMDEATQPAILTGSFHKAALRLFALNTKQITKFDFFSHPHPETLIRAAHDLRAWAFMDDKFEITASGRVADKCQVDPIWYHAIEEAAKLGCAMDMVDIAAVCNTQKSIFANVPGFEQVVNVLRASAAPHPSDHAALVNVFHRYIRERDAVINDDNAETMLLIRCQGRFLNYHALEEARKIRDALTGVLKKDGTLTPSRTTNRNSTAIHKALATAFCTRIAYFHGGVDEYRTVHENVSVRLHPLSSLVGGNFAWIVFNNITVSAGKVYAETASPINAEWLVDLPYFQDDKFPLKGDGSAFRQPKAKASLDAAKARIAARLAKRN
ncbi:Pre-mRNA-splicing factor ATP-dependent RNA helicase PRP43 [Paramyrothecium foliicola]|nr:Pre-mRNA-splicing factor ATP-dependent RNA helicase PRP43 [Paramyrothecium foliicola]